MHLKLLHLQNVPILQQLRIEEALLRASSANWLILNSGSTPAVVFGISGKVEEHVEETCPLPLIRRFSGGGTVVVNQETLFVTHICNKKEASCKPFPCPILHYASAPLKKLLPEFKPRENDYTLGERKFGGNAQSITKERWLHHSSLLFDYDPKLMAHLKMPPTMPNYREKRAHDFFLTTLRALFLSKELFFEKYLENVEQKIEVATLDEVLPLLEMPHRKATKQLQGALGQLTNTVC